MFRFLPRDYPCFGLSLPEAEGSWKGGVVGCGHHVVSKGCVLFRLGSSSWPRLNAVVKHCPIPATSFLRPWLACPHNTPPSPEVVRFGFVEFALIVTGLKNLFLIVANGQVIDAALLWDNCNCKFN